MPKDKKLFSAAECSKHVYEDLLKPLPEGITAMRDIFAGDVDGSHIGEHYNDSLRARIYELNSGEIYVAFRGSDGSANWLNHNIPFLYGSVSNDYKKFAEQVVAEVSKSYSGKEITVTGHSAGGVMGILAALATGWTCYGLDVPDIGDLDFSKSDFSKITLVQSNSVASGKNYSSAHGVKIINVPNNGNPFNAHRISYIISQLEQAGEISAFDELYENFGGKGLEGINNQTKNKLNLLIKNFYIENRKKAFQEVLTSAGTMYSNIQKIGLEVGGAQVVKVGEVGSTLVKLHQSFLGLEINIPILSSVTKLASFLNPVVGVVSGMFSLLSAFGIGRKRLKNNDGLNKALQQMQQQMQMIQQCIQALHQEMRDSFQQVFNNQQKIYEAVIHLSNYMINDFKMPVMESLTSLEDEVHRLQIISGEAQKTIFFQPLEKCLQKLDMYLQGDIVYSSDADEKIISQLGTLSYWIETGSTEALANGSIYLEGHGIGHEMEWVKRVLIHNASLHGLLGYLAANAEQITDEVMQSVDKDQLMNLAVWYTAVSYFLDTLEKFPKLEKYKPNRMLRGIITQADNALSFINSLSSNSLLYKNLFIKYAEIIQNINELIQEKFKKLRAEKNVEQVMTLTIDQLFIVNTSDHVLLEQCLTQLDAINLLLNAYLQLGGLVSLRNNKKIHLLSRKEILAAPCSFLNTRIQGPSWTDGGGYGSAEFYKTIRTKIITLNGKPKLLAMIRNSTCFELHCYDPQQNNWQKLANGPEWKSAYGYNDAQFYETIRTEIITVNGEPKLLAMIRNSLYFELHCYDPRQDSWKALANGPAWTSVSGYNAAQHYQTIHTEIITINGEEKLLAMIRNSLHFELHCYDPQKNNWQKLVNGPEWKTSVGYSDAQFYETIRTEIITINGEQKLLAMIRNSTYFELHSYDPQQDSWKALANGPAWTSVNGYNAAQHYQTIRTEIITINGEEKLLAMIRNSLHFELHCYDPQKNNWQKLVNGPEWKTSVGYSDAQFYETIRTEIITINGEQKLLAMIRNSTHFELHCYDPQKNQWQVLMNGPEWKSTYGYGAVQCYQTLNTQVFNVSENHQEIFLMIRNSSGLECWHYKVAPQLFLSEIENGEQFLQAISSSSSSSSSVMDITNINQFSDVQVLLMNIKMRVHSLLVAKSSVAIDALPNVSASPHAFFSLLGSQNPLQILPQLLDGPLINFLNK